jgi:hypothetical protein
LHILKRLQNLIPSHFQMGYTEVMGLMQEEIGLQQHDFRPE